MTETDYTDYEDQQKAEDEWNRLWNLRIRFMPQQLFDSERKWLAAKFKKQLKTDGLTIGAWLEQQGFKEKTAQSMISQVISGKANLREYTAAIIEYLYTNQEQP